MKQLHLSIKIISVVFTVVFLFTSCQHDKPMIKQHFKVSITTWYRVSPAAPLPVVVNGITYVGLANLPTGGDGNATAMGNINSYANVLAYGPDVKAPPVGSIGAPVNEI